MEALSFELIKQYRAKTFRFGPGLRIKSQEDAVAYVNERGFVYFWPINGVTLPSLWVAAAGDRPVADAHDDPGHVTWGWKDGLLGQRQWYYAKILRKKATMIDMSLAPYFYALTENYGAYDEDYLTQYEQGRLTQEAKSVYESLIRDGPLDTVALRKAVHLTSPSSESRFNKALSDLQADFKIAPVAVTQAGAWHYAFAYDVVARHYPEIPELAHPIRESEARQKLAEVYLRSVGAILPRDLIKLFGWKPVTADRTIDSLVQSGFLHQDIHFEMPPGEPEETGGWIVLADLL